VVSVLTTWTSRIEATPRSPWISWRRASCGSRNANVADIAVTLAEREGGLDERYLAESPEAVPSTGPLPGRCCAANHWTKPPLARGHACDYNCGYAVYDLRFAALAREHLGELRPFDRNRILDEISTHLVANPTSVTARRKLLVGATPAFEHVPPVWQLRVGEFRVIYDVDPRARTVVVRAVLHKGNKTTGEIL
jgi:mRNA-degrading endonuclease RelE of RelBE toxin-antitoxin system